MAGIQLTPEYNVFYFPSHLDFKIDSHPLQTPPSSLSALPLIQSESRVHPKCDARHLLLCCRFSF